MHRLEPDRLMNPGRDEEIAASVAAHRDLGPAYDDAVAAGLVERIGAEADTGRRGRPLPLPHGSSRLRRGRPSRMELSGSRPNL